MTLESLFTSVKWLLDWPQNFSASENKNDIKKKREKGKRICDHMISYHMTSSLRPCQCDQMSR